MPTLEETGSRYKSCCGKVICSGCIHAVQMRDGNLGLCPFCRVPTPNRTKFPSAEEEIIKRYKKRRRLDLNDPIGICDLGYMHRDGELGLPRSYAKSLELWHRAAELGSADAYYGIASAYSNGNGVEVDKKKARHYCELAAMIGDAEARHNLGVMEWQAGNYDRALRHFMIAVKDGGVKALSNIKSMYSYGDVTRDDYTTALRSYQAYLNEIKSDQRDKAAAEDEDYKYYESPS